jgi:hypothetical protein
MRTITSLFDGFLLYTSIAFWASFISQNTALSGLPSPLLMVPFFVCILCLFSLRSHAHSLTEVAEQSFFWLLTIVALDAWLVMPFVGIRMFFEPFLWGMYALVVVVPLCVSYMHAPSVNKENMRV